MRAENQRMNLHGRIHNGVVVLEGGQVLPEGTEVTVTCDKEATTKPIKKRRIELPLVRSKNPGGLHLTGERIAEILDEEDASKIFQSSKRMTKLNW